MTAHDRLTMPPQDSTEEHTRVKTVQTYHPHNKCSLQENAATPKPIFVCCGSIGVIFTIVGATVLAIGKYKLKTTADYT